MVRSQKSIGGAVGSRLGNAPYKIGDLLRSAFGIALGSFLGRRERDKISQFAHPP
ncbi:MAG: hypothetical protein RPG89_02720 [Microcystis panniformis WG22]|nr:hypothetical protein [Microcystis panniformis WG22]